MNKKELHIENYYICKLCQSIFSRNMFNYKLYHKSDDYITCRGICGSHDNFSDEEFFYEISTKDINLIKLLYHK